MIYMLLFRLLVRRACGSHLDGSRSLHCAVLVTAEGHTGTTLHHLHRQHGRTQQTNHDQSEGRSTTLVGSRRGRGVVH